MKKKNMFLPNCGEKRGRRLVYDLDKGLLSTNEIREFDHNKSLVTKKTASNLNQLKLILHAIDFLLITSSHLF